MGSLALCFTLGLYGDFGFRLDGLWTRQVGAIATIALHCTATIVQVAKSVFQPPFAPDFIPFGTSRGPYLATILAIFVFLGTQPTSTSGRLTY